jgi:hypothetical protein
MAVGQGFASDGVRHVVGRPSRRRVKVIGRRPGETRCLPLVCAVLDRARRGWRGHPNIRRSGCSEICAANCWTRRSTLAPAEANVPAPGSGADSDALSA